MFWNDCIFDLIYTFINIRLWESGHKRSELNTATLMFKNVKCILSKLIGTLRVLRDLPCDEQVWLNYAQIQRKWSMKIDIRSIQIQSKYFEAIFTSITALVQLLHVLMAEQIRSLKPDLKEVRNALISFKVWMLMCPIPPVLSIINYSKTSSKLCQIHGWKTTIL